MVQCGVEGGQDECKICGIDAGLNMLYPSKYPQNCLVLKSSFGFVNGGGKASYLVNTSAYSMPIIDCC